MNHGCVLCRFSNVQYCTWDFPGKNAGVGCYAPSRVSFWSRDQTQVSSISCFAHEFFTAQPPRSPQIDHKLVKFYEWLF